MGVYGLQRDERVSTIISFEMGSTVKAWTWCSGSVSTKIKQINGLWSQAAREALKKAPTEIRIKITPRINTSAGIAGTHKNN